MTILTASFFSSHVLFSGVGHLFKCLLIADLFEREGTVVDVVLDLNSSFAAKDPAKILIEIVIGVLERIKGVSVLQDAAHECASANHELKSALTFFDADVESVSFNDSAVDFGRSDSGAVKRDDPSLGVANSAEPLEVGDGFFAFLGQIESLRERILIKKAASLNLLVQHRRDCVVACVEVMSDFHFASAKSVFWEQAVGCIPCDEACRGRREGGSCEKSPDGHDLGVDDIDPGAGSSTSDPGRDLRIS